MINIFLILNIDMDFNYDVANMPGTYYTLLLKIFNNKLLNLVRMNLQLTLMVFKFCLFCAQSSGLVNYGEAWRPQL